MTKKFAVNFCVYYQNTQSVSEMKTISREKIQSFNCHDQLKIYASKITSLLKHTIDVTSPVLTLNHCFIYYCLAIKDHLGNNSKQSVYFYSDSDYTSDCHLPLYISNKSVEASLPLLWGQSGVGTQVLHDAEISPHLISQAC